MEEFGIVVLTFNRLERLQSCLDHIFSRTKASFKLYVVDNYSTDGTQEYLEGFSANQKLVYIRMDSNVGVLARNVAFRQITAPFIAQIDDDVTVDPDWDSKCLQLMNSDSQIGLICHQGARIKEWPHFEVQHEDCFVDCATGFFMCFRNVGLLFDENIERFWCEDLDLSLQFKEKGYRIFCTPTLCSHASARDIPIDLDLYNRNHDYVFKKWASRLASLGLEA